MVWNFFFFSELKEIGFEKKFWEGSIRGINVMEGLIRVVKCMELGIFNNRIFIILYIVLKW